MFTVSLSGVLLLFLLHHSTLDSVDGQIIDSNTLAHIITFFEQNYKSVDNNIERQYAVAINVPKHQCEAGFTPSQNNFLTDENAADVRRDIVNQNYPVYQGKELIAAGVIRKKGYTIHSERLLLNPTEERPTPPMQNLLNERTEDSCTVLYTLNSPCTRNCLNNDKEYNILKGLETWSTHSGIKAFVFKTFWSKESSSRELLQERFKEIVKYVPLYRCEHDNECYACGGQGNAPIDEHCLPNSNSQV